MSELRPTDPTAPQKAIPVIGDEPAKEQARRWFARWREHAEAPSEPPHTSRRIDNFTWGLAQPVLGLRVLVSNRELLLRGLGPALAFLLLCLLVADRGEATGSWSYVEAYYATLVGAAPLSPVLFTRNYARLAAAARRYLDVDEHEPYLRGYWQALVESFVQLLVVGIGVAPFVGLISLLPVPYVPEAIGGAILSVWTLHWIVVEALDSARSLPPGMTVAEFEQRKELHEAPWFSGERIGHPDMHGSAVLKPLRWWGSLVANFSERWRSEIHLIETQPWIAVGFGLGAALLLAIPVVNVLFRPALVVAASHVLGRLEPE